MKTTILILWTLLLTGTATGWAAKTQLEDSEIYWQVTDDTLLTISGTGAIPDYPDPNSTPWYSYKGWIKRLIIGEGITTIGNNIFAGYYSLSFISIPNSVINIGSNAFDATDWLSKQPEGCVYAGKVLYVYKGEMLPNATIQLREGTLGIAGSAFRNCSSLTSITIPDKVITIGAFAFWNCSSLASITIPNSVTTIGNDAFNGCSGLRETLTIPNSVTRIDTCAFSRCSGLNAVTIGHSLTTISNGVFSFCSDLTSITIPESVTSIGDQAFSYCSGLTSITIPASVTSIGGHAFYDCRSLTSVTNLNLMPQSIISNVFGNVNLSDATLYVPAGSVEAYRAAVAWKDFGTIAEYAPSAITAPVFDGFAVPTQVIVSDMNGRIVWRQTVKGNENIAIGHLPKGVYLIRVNGKTVKVVTSDK